MALTVRQTFAASLSTARVPRSFEHAEAGGKPTPPDGDFTVTADAGTDLLTTAEPHYLTVDTPVRFTNAGGALPAGFSAATTYYVLASGLTEDDFKVSATVGGSAVNITDAGTGTHTVSRYLTTDERAKVDSFLAFVANGTGPLPTAADSATAAALITAYGLYHQSPAYLTWWHDNQLSRDAQYQLRRADMFEANDTTVPPSATDDGVGSDEPDSPIPRGTV